MTDSAAPRPGRHGRGRCRPAILTIYLTATLLLSGCGGADPEGPSSVTLTAAMEDAAIRDTPQIDPPAPVIWNFGDGSAPGTIDDEMLGAVALHDIAGLELRDGQLQGTTSGSRPIVHIPVAADAGVEDVLHAVELRMRVSGGDVVALAWDSDEELDGEEAIEEARNSEAPPPLNAPVTEDGGEVRTYTLSTATLMGGGPPLSRMRHLLLVPGRAEGIEFAVESIRLVSRKEHLESIPSGVSWQGLAEIYRETLVTRAPERVAFQVRLPEDPWLDLHVGSIEPGVATFSVALEESGQKADLIRRTVTTADRWEHLEVDLEEWAGRTVTLELQGTANEEGTLLFWGGPVVRSRGDTLRTGRAAEALADLTDAPRPPRRVLFILADTLRRDRLPFYGGERDNAPVLNRLAEEGMVFTHDVSQGTWTKVSVPSILTSLYPTSHGISDIPDRLPASVDTMAEVLREAGYATYATSSVPFTGKLTNLHQGIEVLHEATSIQDLPHSPAKTARTYVDRLLPWIDEHAETPWFVFLHVFDPHSPLEPYAPYDTLYADDEEIAAHRERMERVQEHIENDHMRGDVMPTSDELAAAEVDPEAFVDTELDWYDGSIRGMDAEIGRVLERLEQLQILEDTLIVFLSDHGEEFLEHGRHFHGNNAYGEMINVPLMMWWPGVIPAGRSDQVVQSIDVFPTVLELARQPVPGQAQGQSLLPLMARPERPASLGWLARPAFAERARMVDSSIPLEEQVAQRVIVADGWKLIRNVERPEGRAEFELYDYLNDPLDQNDVSADHPDVVERLGEELAVWHEAALAARVEEASTEEMSAAELERLRSLGYIQ